MTTSVAALPDELVIVIFVFVGPDVVRARRVCKLWLALADDVLVGRHVTLRLPPNCVPVVSPGLDGIVFMTKGCRAATVAAVLRRYPRLRRIAVWTPTGDALIEEPPATLRHVTLGLAPRARPSYLMLLAAHAETLVVNVDVATFLRRPDLSRLRAIDAIIGCRDVDDDDGIPYDALRAAFRSMVNLRYIQLQVDIKEADADDADAIVIDPLPATVDHVDTKWLSDAADAALPTGLKSADSNTLDPRRFPQLRVLMTRCSPRESFASLHALIVYVPFPEESASTLATLTQLRFLSVAVQACTATPLVRALAQLPHLMVLVLMFPEPTDRDVETETTWQVQTDDGDAAVSLPWLRRLAIVDPPPAASPLTLPSLPAVEVAVVRFGGRERARCLSFWYCAAHRTPWTADERDIVLRAQALSVDSNVSTADEHDALCFHHHAPSAMATAAVPTRMYDLPLVSVERTRMFCSCQLLTY
jgi:hypothetical protein